MVKRRMIHDCLWQSEGVANLTYRQRCLWIGLITTADDQGRAKAHPGIIRGAVFPFDDISQDEIADDLQAIESAGMVLVYQVEGKAYYQVVKWWDYQKPQWVGPSDHPAPDGWKDRLRYHGKGHKVITDNWYDEEKELPDNKGDKSPNPLPLALGKGKEEVKVKEDTMSVSEELKSLRNVYVECFPEKAAPRISAKSYRTKMAARMKDAYFRDNWEKAIRRAARGSMCRDGGWFDLLWFLKNDTNWEKCLNGNYDERKSNGNGRPRIDPFSGEVPAVNRKMTIIRAGHDNT